jgi:hypothetical protein
MRASVRRTNGAPRLKFGAPIVIPSIRHSFASVSATNAKMTSLSSGSSNIFPDVANPEAYDPMTAPLRSVIATGNGAAAPFGSFHTSERRGGVERRQLKLKGVEGGD